MSRRGGGGGDAGISAQKEHHNPARAAASGMVRARSLPGTLSGNGMPASRDAHTIGWPIYRLDDTRIQNRFRLSTFVANLAQDVEIPA